MDHAAAVPRLDRAAMLRWLSSPHVVAPDGRVWSWHNPAHPGYAYPEAGGLWLSLLARSPRVDPTQLERVGRWLETCEQHGQLGRDGREYLFDRGMVLAGQLARHERAQPGPPLRHQAAVSRLLDDLGGGRAVHPGPVEASAPPRWSERFGPHLLKLALPLSTWAEATGQPLGLALVALREHLDAVRPDGRVPTGPPGSPTYLHAHCYAAEGLWRLSEAPVPDRQRQLARAAAERAASWLARVQRPDGGLPPWHDGARGWGPAPADVAAQAVRLWSGLDRQALGPAIDRGLGFLARLATPTGGLRYHEHSDDLNTWATVFAVQALDFSRGHADVRRLV